MRRLGTVDAVGLALLLRRKYPPAAELYYLSADALLLLIPLLQVSLLHPTSPL